MIRTTLIVIALLFLIGCASHQLITQNLFFHGSQVKIVLPEGIPDFTFYEKTPFTITKDIGLWRYYGGLGHFKSKNDPIYDLFLYVDKPIVIALVSREGDQQQHWIYDNNKPVRVSEARFIDYMGELFQRLGDTPV